MISSTFMQYWDSPPYVFIRLVIILLTHDVALWHKVWSILSQSIKIILELIVYSSQTSQWLFWEVLGIYAAVRHQYQRWDSQQSVWIWFHDGRIQASRTKVLSAEHCLLFSGSWCSVLLRAHQPSKKYFNGKNENSLFDSNTQSIQELF